MLPFAGGSEPTEPASPASSRADSVPIIFGLIGTLVGVLALAIVITMNCDRLGIPLCQGEDPVAATSLLPDIDRDRYLASTNPHQPGSLGPDVSQLLDAIPAADKPRARSFIAGATFFTDRLDQVRRAASCGYRPGDLAVRRYTDRDAAWSVGLAVVVPGALTDVFDAASPCFLGHRIAAMVPVGDGDDPPPAFCGVTVIGDTTTLLTLGSTVGVCAELTRQPTLVATTVGHPDAAVRPGATVTGEPTLRVRPGTTGVVLCQIAGWARMTFPVGTPDALTGKSTEDERTGYVAVADLDAGAEIDQRIRPCAATPSTTPGTGPSTGPSPGPPPPAPFNPTTLAVDACVANRGTPSQPDMLVVDCTDPAGYRVLRKQVGVTIPESPGDVFDAATAEAVCAGSGYDTWYGFNPIDDSADVFLCLSANTP